MEVKNLNKSFGDKTLYENLSFKIGSGKIFALIGPNGVGKTTLMKLILGWDKAYSGQILIPNGLTLSYSPESPEFPEFLRGDELLDFFIGLRKAEDNSKDLWETIFNPMVTGEDSRSGEANRGLGLANVKRICQIHNWQVFYNEKGFQIKFS